MALAKTREYNIKFTERGAQQLQNATQKIDNSFSKLAKTAVSAFVVERVAAYGIEFAKLAGQVEGLQGAFNRLAASEGANAVQLFNDLERATNGTVAKIDLLKATTQGKFLGVDLKNMPVLFEFAARRARETGQSVDFLVQSIVTGIGRKSALILDNLGITMNELNKEMERIAKATGLWTGKLDESTKAAVLQEAAVNIAKRAIKDSGDVALTAADKIAQYEKSFNDLKVSIGEFAVFVGGFLAEMFTPGKGLIQFNVDELENFRKKVDQVATAVNKNRGMLDLNSFSVNVLVEKMKRANAASREFAENMKELRKSLAGIPKTLEFTTFQQDKLNAKQREQMGILQEVAGAYDGFSISLSNLIIETSAGWDYAREKFMQFGDSMSSVFKRNLKEGENLFSGLLESFTDMLAQMVAELLARAAIFGLLSLFGIPMGGASLGSFVLGGMSSTGGLQAATGGGIQPPASVPNSPMRGGGQTNITVNTIDAASFESFLRYRNGAQIISRTLPEVLG